MQRKMDKRARRRDINNRLCYYQSGDRWKKNKSGLYKTERHNKQIKRTYSDHNAILINVDFISPKKVSRERKRM